MAASSQPSSVTARQPSSALPGFSLVRRRAAFRDQRRVVSRRPSRLLRVLSFEAGGRYPLEVRPALQGLPGGAPAQQRFPEPRPLLQSLLEDLDGQAVVALARGQAGAHIGDIDLVPGIARAFRREQIEGAGIVLLAVELHHAGIE